MAREDYSKLRLSRIRTYSAGQISSLIDLRLLTEEQTKAVCDWTRWNVETAKWTPTSKRPTRNIDQTGFSVGMQTKTEDRNPNSYLAIAVYEDYAIAVIWDGSDNVHWIRDRCEEDASAATALGLKD